MVVYTSVINLTLKVITHYGEFKEYKIRDLPKLIGKDIILAHQLLKNDIPHHEYWLITDSLAATTPNLFKPWMQWKRGSKQLSHTDVLFHYVQLGALKEN